MGISKGRWSSARMLAHLFFVYLCVSATICEEPEYIDFPEDDDVSVTSEKMNNEFEIEYLPPVPSGPVYFAESFDDFDIAKKRWVSSRAQKEEENNVFKYEGRFEFDLPQKQIFMKDRGLVLKTRAQHAAISAKLDRKFEFTTKPLIIQYEVNFQSEMDCGGAYIKLLSFSKDLSLDKFHDKTPYTIMFGPDKCGNDIKLHFIFRHKNPVNGSHEEKHAKKPSNRLEENFKDGKPHVYRLKLTSDNRFEIYVDGKLINSGNLLDDMEPPVNPPMEIEDPDDKKPSDWDEREMIPDPDAVKPDDWDENAPPKIPDPNAVMPEGWLQDEKDMIPNAEAKMPEDWDDSMDGSWEAPLVNNPVCETAPGCGPWNSPMIDNPNFKGKWQPPTINNPKFKGKWSRRKIQNPNYFEDKEPFKMTAIGAVGLELWSMTDLILFDNFIVADNDEVVDDWTSQTYDLKRRALDRDSEGVITRIINYSNAHPWLWAIYIFVVGLPLVLIFTFCCGSSQDKKLGDAHPKKTDAVVPDDEPMEAEADVSMSSSSAKKPRKNVQHGKDMTKEEIAHAETESEDDDDDEEEEEADGQLDEDYQEGNANENNDDEEDASDDDSNTNTDKSETQELTPRHRRGARRTRFAD